MNESTTTANQELSADPADFLAASDYLDYDHPLVQAFVADYVGDATDDTGKAVNLFYAVRDELRYDPYAISLEANTYKASHVIEQGSGYCVQKGAVYTAVCRKVGIPARVGYADVCNHIATERLLELMQTNLFVYHGYVEVFLDGQWVKATPVFNRTLCEKFHILPLEFDGKADSLFHPFDAKGRKHMEYVRDRGVRGDVPFDEIKKAFADTYPVYFKNHVGGVDFETEAAKEGRTAEFKPAAD